MVKDAADDAKLRSVNHQASGSEFRPSKHSGSSSNSQHGRGGICQITSSLFSDSNYIGGRVRFSADFWPTLTNDPWVIRSVTEGVRIPFCESPSVPFAQPNMCMSPELENICDKEVQTLL